MLCLSAKVWARDASRAATAATTTSAFCLAGLMSAVGAIRAAPRMPIRTCPDTHPTLALELCRWLRESARLRACGPWTNSRQFSYLRRTLGGQRFGNVQYQ